MAECQIEHRSGLKTSRSAIQQSARRCRSADAILPEGLLGICMY